MAATLLTELQEEVDSLRRSIDDEFERLRAQREMAYRRALCDTWVPVIKFKQKGAASRRSPLVRTAAA